MRADSRIEVRRLLCTCDADQKFEAGIPALLPPGEEDSCDLKRFASSASARLYAHAATGYHPAQQQATVTFGISLVVIVVFIATLSKM